MNEQKTIISVIIPFYNNKKSIARTITSIRRQSFQEFELLLIDDGSTDDSYDQALEAIDGDERCHLYHQENKGVSAARNLGLDKATGEYVCFVDGDDYVGCDYIKHLYSLMISLPEKKVAMVISSAHVIDTKADVLAEITLPRRIIQEPSFASLFSEIEIVRYGYSWGKLFNLEVIQRNGLRFPPFPNREDLIFVLHYLSLCDIVNLADDHDYFYVKDTNSTESLSVKVAPFECEYTAFDMYVCCIEDFSKRYAIPSDTLKTIYKGIMLTFERGLKTDFQPGTIVPWKERIAHLKRMVAVHRQLVETDYHPDYLIDRVLRFLLLHGLYSCYDLSVRLVFLLNIRNKMTFGPK